MQIHRVRGANLKDALVRAKRAHGEDALVISQESVPGGIALAVAHRAEPEPRDSGRIKCAPDGPRAELAARLERHGASSGFVARILAAVSARRASDRHVLDLAADAIGELFPPARFSKLARRTRVLAFTGASGVGKTTTILKLARKLKAAGRRIELATLDTERARAPYAAHALAELRSGSRELEVPLTLLRSNVRVQPGAFTASRIDVLLLDTRGDPAREREKLARLAATLRAAGAAFDACLVLPATASAAALARVRSDLGTLAPAASVITKLDETRAPVAALETSLAIGARVAFLAGGPDLDLVRADGERIADLFLRGRLA